MTFLCGQFTFVEFQYGQATTSAASTVAFTVALCFTLVLLGAMGRAWMRKVRLKRETLAKAAGPQTPLIVDARVTWHEQMCFGCFDGGRTGPVVL